VLMFMCVFERVSVCTRMSVHVFACGHVGMLNKGGQIQVWLIVYVERNRRRV